MLSTIRGIPSGLPMLATSSIGKTESFGTWIGFQNKNNLDILFENDKSLFNPYGVIAVSPEKFPYVEYEKSNRFIEWLLKGRGNNIISNYTIDGQKLFFTYN